MTYITNVFLFLALVYAVSCIPIDQPSTQVTGAAGAEISTAKPEHQKRKKSDSSEESKESESRESSEEVKKRPTRHTESSAESAHQTKHEPANSNQSPKIVSAMATVQPELPARERRNSDHIQTSSPNSVSHHTTNSKPKESSATVSTPIKVTSA